MPAYVYVELQITDVAAYVAEYAKHVPPLIEKHGGNFLARGGKFEVMEGDAAPDRVVLFQFPDMQAVRSFLSDPEYAALKAVRHRLAKSKLVAFEGL